MFGFDLLHAIYRRLFAHMRARSLWLFNTCIMYTLKYNKHEWRQRNSSEAKKREICYPRSNGRIMDIFEMFEAKQHEREGMNETDKEEKRKKMEKKRDCNLSKENS